MSSKYSTIFFLFSSLIFASMVHAITNDDSTTQTQPNSDIKINIHGDTQRGYQEEARTSGPQADDDSEISDRRIQTEIMNLIKSKFRKYNINIKVSQGIVTLKGSVQNDEIKQNVESDVRKIQGVTTVNNQLVIQERK